MNNPLPTSRAAPSRLRRAFTLIELMVVVGIIVLLVAIMIPALKALTKGNDISQSTNLVRSMISSARTIAISQHRRAGVVFFEETPTYSAPAHPGQTAMQIIIEDFLIDQSMSDRSGTVTTFTDYSTTREYLPVGIKLATLGGVSGTFNLADNSSTATQTRVILFDADGQLLLRSGLDSLCFLGPVNSTTPGSYPYAQNDWKLGAVGLATIENQMASGNAPVSSPGFLLYSKTDFDAAGLNTSATTDPQRSTWLLSHADVVIINSNTGTVVVQQ